jgi:hypothetical protein
MFGGHGCGSETIDEIQNWIIETWLGATILLKWQDGIDTTTNSDDRQSWCDVGDAVREG